MREQVEVQKLDTQEQFAEMSDWMAKLAGRNAIDPAIFSYPSLHVERANRGDKNLLYMPVQNCFVLESLAINPENSSFDTAEALKAIFVVVHHEARAQGRGETYFLCSDKSTCSFAEHQGLENLTDNDRLTELITAAELAIGSHATDPLQHSEAMARLDSALNEYKKNPGLKTYRKRHIRPKSGV